MVVARVAESGRAPSCRLATNLLCMAAPCALQDCGGSTPANRLCRVQPPRRLASQPAATTTAANGARDPLTGSRSARCHCCHCCCQRLPCLTRLSTSTPPVPVLSCYHFVSISPTPTPSLAAGLRVHCLTCKMVHAMLLAAAQEHRVGVSCAMNQQQRYCACSRAGPTDGRWCETKASKEEWWRESVREGVCQTEIGGGEARH
jgi:hypothetical protein